MKLSRLDFPQFIQDMQINPHDFHNSFKTMKKILIILALTHLAAFGEIGVTLPSGFVTYNLKAGQFNILGMTMHGNVKVTGTLDVVTGTTLTDNDEKFENSLITGKTYILEIVDASDDSLNGTIQEITVWNGNTITTSLNLAV